MTPAVQREELKECTACEEVDPAARPVCPSCARELVDVQAGAVTLHVCPRCLVYASIMIKCPICETAISTMLPSRAALAELVYRKVK